ncbi:hypothetical protein KC351_g15299 [Hortaea werneckii]|nr:hypothetical protein KC351_g15299 [Hortaea werneckii]
MSYEVYQVDYAGAPLNHQGVFVKMDDKTNSGRLFHVKGSLQQGMSFEEKAAPWREDSLSYQAMTRLGVVDISDFERFQQVCATLPAPKKQFQLSRRLYPDEPLRTCQEWTKEVIDDLKSQDVLKTS